MSILHCKTQLSLSGQQRGLCNSHSHAEFHMNRCCADQKLWHSSENRPKTKHIRLNRPTFPFNRTHRLCSGLRRWDIFWYMFAVCFFLSIQIKSESVISIYRIRLWLACFIALMRIYDIANKSMRLGISWLMPCWVVSCTRPPLAALSSALLSALRLDYRASGHFSLNGNFNFSLARNFDKQPTSRTPKKSTQHSDNIPRSVPWKEPQMSLRIA